MADYYQMEGIKLDLAKIQLCFRKAQLHYLRFKTECPSTSHGNRIIKCVNGFVVHLSTPRKLRNLHLNCFLFLFSFVEIHTQVITWLLV